MGRVTWGRMNGTLRDEGVGAAYASFNDCIDPADPSRVVPCESPGEPQNLANDVDPEASGDICDAARSSVDALGNPVMPEGAVRNASVAEACDRADRAERTAIAGFALAGIGLATTVVFTALLFFPLRKNRKQAAALRRRAPSVGFMPAPGGGTFSGSIRF